MRVSGELERASGRWEKARKMVTARFGRRAVKAKVLAAAGAVALQCASALATTTPFTWSGMGTDALWSDAGNWVSGLIPPNNGTGLVLFPPLASGLTSTQDVGAPFQVGAILFTGSGYSVGGQTIRLSSYLTDLGGSGVMNTISNPIMLTGMLPVAAQNLELSGSITSASGVLNASLNVGVTNTLLTLTGTNSDINNLEVVGGSVVLDGGSLTTTSINQVSVTDAVAVGAKLATSATLTVQNGATLDTSTASDVGIAAAAGGTAQMTVTGKNSLWKLPGEANIGELGPGSLTVTNGAMVTGSVSSIFFVGDNGAGTFVVSSGGSVTDAVSLVGTGSTAQVTGTGSIWTSTNLAILNNGQLTVQSGGAVVAGNIGFSNTSGTDLTVTGGIVAAASLSSSSGAGAISLADPVAGIALTINGTSNTATYSGTISGNGSLLKTGASTQVLTGANTYGGSTQISGGALVIDGVGALPSGAAVMIGNGGALDIANHGTGAKIVPQLASLNILSVGGGIWNGLVDLSNNDLIVHNGNLANISSQLFEGFNSAHGNWNGAGGITSSAAAATNNMGLAVELNNNGSGGTWTSSFDGQTVVSTDVLVKYTFFGDANFDGVVNSTDYIAIDNGFNSKLTGWRNGDFNYDGVVNGDDYTLIDNAFNTQVMTSALSVAAGATEMIALDTSQVAVVPEPGSLGLMGIAGALWWRRRRAL